MLEGAVATAYVSTPNVLTLAPEGAERSGNPWHLKEYRADEFGALCRAHFADVELLGLFHARKLRAHELALRHARWDDVHRRLGITSAFYDRFTPAISERDFALRSERDGADLDGALDFAGRSLPAVSAARGDGRGALALVLHTHMPYVEGFGTWPFGEEWLWEAAATSWLPLLDVLDDRASRSRSRPCWPTSSRRRGGGAAARLPRDLRARTHALDLEAAPAALRPELERSARGDYARAAERLDALGGDLPGRSWRARRWTRAATHAVLPLLRDRRRGPAAAPDRDRRAPARASATPWRGGFWLPECAHAPWLDPLLEQAGVHATCVDLTDVLGPATPGTCGRGARRPGRCSSRSTAPWSSSSGATRGYPAARRLPRLPPPDGAPPPRRGPTTARPTTRAAPPGRSPPTPPTSCARGRRAGARRRAVRLRARHRAARALVVRGPGLAGRGAGRGRPRGPGGASRSTTRWPTSTPRTCRPAPSAGDDVGDAADALDVVGPAGRRPRRAARARRSCGSSPRGPPRATARCASCSRCSPATGPSWPRAGRPARTRASAPPGTARRSTGRWPATRATAACGRSRRTWRARPCWRPEDVPSPGPLRCGAQTTHIAELPPH